MAIAVLFEVPGMSTEQYDRVIRDLGAAGQGAPKGRRYHVNAKRPKGSFVLDIWESPEELAAFAGVLMPILVKNGVDPLPDPQILPLHSVIAG
ncbi:MAG: hypothetical protein AAB289_00965 [Chloroflexota bacterium]